MGAKLTGYVSVAFSAIYTAIILLVYYAQLTTVRLNELTQQAAILLDFQKCGLLFNDDLLGYAVMLFAAFFRIDSDITDESRPMVKISVHDTRVFLYIA